MLLESLQALRYSIPLGPITQFLFGTKVVAILIAVCFLTVFSFLVMLPHTRYGTPKVRTAMMAITILLALVFLLNISFILMDRM